MQTYKDKTPQAGTKQNMNVTTQIRQSAAAPKNVEMTNGIPNSVLQDVFAGKRHADSSMMGHSRNLAPSIAAKMSRAFGMDLTGMQVYQSDAMKGSGMRGMASGNKVVLSSDVNLNTTAGQAVLGHEISHIHAQSQGIGMGRSGLYENAALEHQADTEGLLAAQGRSIYSDGMDTGIGMSYGLGMQGVEGLTPLSGGMSASAGAPMQADEEKNGPLGWIKGLFSGKKKEPEEGLIAVEQNANPILGGNGGQIGNETMTQEDIEQIKRERTLPIKSKNDDASTAFSSGLNPIFRKGSKDNIQMSDMKTEVRPAQKSGVFNGTKVEFFKKLKANGGINGDVKYHRKLMRNYATLFDANPVSDHLSSNMKDEYRAWEAEQNRISAGNKEKTGVPVQSLSEADKLAEKIMKKFPSLEERTGKAQKQVQLMLDEFRMEHPGETSPNLQEIIKEQKNAG